MAVISQQDYLSIAVAYANARDQVLGAKDYLFDAVYLIVLFDEIKPSVDLLSVFYDAYSINTETLRAPTLFLSAVRALNQHVLLEGNFANVDAFLEQGSGILVPQSWADLCASAGFTISQDNIG